MQIHHVRSNCHLTFSLIGTKIVSPSVLTHRSKLTLLNCLPDPILIHQHYSFTSKGLNYWQNLCELQHAHEDAAEYKLNNAKFTTQYETNNEVN